MSGRPGRGALIAILLAVGTGWGSSQATGKMAAETGQGPFGIMFWQLAICTVLLGAISLVRGRGLVLSRPALRFYVVVAVLGTLVPNYTFYASVVHLPAGVMSLVIALVPMISLPLAVLAGIDRFSALRVAGLGLGLAGVGLIAAPGGAALAPEMLRWLPVAMIGPLFYALEATWVAKSGTAGMDAVQAMFGASAVGLVLCVPLVLGTGQFYLPGPPFDRSEIALLVMSVSHAALYATYVWLAATAGAVFAAQSSYVVTVTGVFWAMLLLGERFPPLVWLAMAAMLVGVALVQPRVAARAGGKPCSA
ncbi:DMT family transporter [Rhodobacter sp. Har01]|uniref:DMT family transporter n=1 Tax=Rhodobacter sp. Har01 TaxID=2883999 RepID=UPI001D095120|nr:DMT family transporter [Rhodobacter sp. Har01]MCB6178396.1 DMT family transporter [Rhodobacter sp. Har01]